MSVLHFDEEELKGVLAHLPIARTTAFAASCAGRLARDVDHAEPGSESCQILSEAGSALWQRLRSGDSFDVGSFEERLMDVMPDEVDDGEFTAAVVEDATASMIYALRSLYTDSVANAAWAARRVYETADRYASRSLNEFEYSEAAEAQILLNPIVQLELNRQLRDLNLLMSGQKDIAVFSELQDNLQYEHVLETTQLRNYQLR